MSTSSAASSAAKDAAARKNEKVLMELLKDDGNKQCADCGQKGTRWASWNLGVFLCIRCGGLHRRLGTHISRVKSVNLDKWTDEQVQSMVEKGNVKVNTVYNPHPDRFPFPSYSGDQENWIRDKYERKLFMKPEDRATMNQIGATSSTPNVIQRTLRAPSTTGSNEPRYPIQMKSLVEMGFTDTAANQAALLSTGGNLPQAIEALLAGKFTQVQISSPKSPSTSPTHSASAVVTKRIGQKSTSTFDELLDVFGPPPTMTAASSTGGKSADLKNSIIDMDLPPPNQPDNTFTLGTGTTRRDSTGDEFDDFAFATPVAPNSNLSTGEASTAKAELPFSNGRRTSVSDDIEHQPSHQHGNIEHQPSSHQNKSPPMRALAGLDTTSLGNPWASNNNISTSHTGEDAFDDLDPFRGFTAPKH